MTREYQLHNMRMERKYHILNILSVAFTVFSIMTVIMVMDWACKQPDEYWMASIWLCTIMAIMLALDCILFLSYTTYKRFQYKDKIW